METDPQFELWTAAGEGRLSELRSLVESGVDINCAFSEGISALHIASLHGHREIVSYFVEKGADVNRASDSGLSALMSACAQGFFDVAKFLVEHGANVSAVKDQQETPLLYLCRARQWRARISTGAGSIHGFYKICRSESNCGCMNLVHLLMDAGAEVNHRDVRGGTALMGFIMSRHFDLAKYLLQAGANPNYIHSEGCFALLVACRLKDSLDLVKAIILSGANVNQSTDDEGITPLMSACYRGLDMVETLLNAGASVNATNWKGDTALRSAVFATNPDIIECLIKAGVKIDKEMILAVIIGNGENIQRLMMNGALPKQNGSMQSLKPDIEYLSRRFNVTTSNFLVHRLLKRLADLSIETLTPFIVSLMRKSDLVARYLIKNLFFNPVDVRLLVDYMQQPSDVENDGISCHLLPLVTQPWSLFNLSFLAVSFAVGFNEERKERVSKTGLPASLQRKMLFQDRNAHIAVHDWANIVVSL